MTELVAGRELDALVAVKVMRWEPASGGYYFIGPWNGTPPRRMVCMEPGDGAAPHWSPSTDIAAAFAVAECFDEVELHKGPHGWLCRLERGPGDEVQHGEAFRAETASLAICRAALALVKASGRPATGKFSGRYEIIGDVELTPDN